MSKKSIAQLKRDSKMLDQILGIVADMVHEDDRPMFDAILTYWRNGWKTMTPIERVALDDRRRDWRIGAGLGQLEQGAGNSQPGGAADAGGCASGDQRGGANQRWKCLM